jgi:hypothetical protein
MEKEASGTTDPLDIVRNVRDFLESKSDCYNPEKYYNIRRDDRDGKLITTMSLSVYPELLYILSDTLSRAVHDEEEGKTCGVAVSFSDKNKCGIDKCGIDFIKDENHKLMTKCAVETLDPQMTGLSRPISSCFRVVNKWGGWVMPYTREHYTFVKEKMSNDVMWIITRLSRTNVNVFSTRVKLDENPHIQNALTLHVEHTASGRFRYFLEEYDLITKEMMEMLEMKEINIKSDRPCYELYWIITNMCVMSRGSAGAAKAVLNAALHYLGFKMVREKEPYKRQVDWVSMFCPDFQDFYERKGDFFEDVEDVEDVMTNQAY